MVGKWLTVVERWQPVANFLFPQLRLCVKAHMFSLPKFNKPQVGVFLDDLKFCCLHCPGTALSKMYRFVRDFGRLRPR